MLVAVKLRRRVTTTGLVGVVVVGLLLGSVHAADDAHRDYKLSGVGGFPISDSITSMWLNGPNGKPLLMAFFTGRPPGWQNTKWQTSSNFQKDGAGWAEFTCATATQRLWLDPDTGQAEIQRTKANVRESNVFVVVNVTGPPKSQRIIPLGLFEISKSGDHPASDQLLRDHPELQERILKESSSGGGN
jgi:hypothetical protein